MTDKYVVIFYEGDTEEEFYKKVVSKLRAFHNGQLNCKVDCLNVKGIGNYKNRVLRLFIKQIKPDYEKYEYIVFLCYDYDVFKFSNRPPVNMAEVEISLKAAGASKVVQIIANDSIENWFLKDSKGILKYLRLGKSIKIQNRGSSVDILKSVFKKANKIYVKGQKTAGFIDALDLELIMGKICETISPICKELEIDCSHQKRCK